MEPHFIILIPCSRGVLFTNDKSAPFIRSFPLIYLSKPVHLQSALSVGYRRADINEAFRFIRLAGRQATRGSIDFFGFCDAFFFPSPHFFSLSLAPPSDHNEKHAWRISLVCRALSGDPLPPTPPRHSLFLSRPVSSPLLLLLYSLPAQRKSSYLNWPQEPPLSDFNAPYSVDSISITLVTKD